MYLAPDPPPSGSYTTEEQRGVEDTKRIEAGG